MKRTIAIVGEAETVAADLIPALSKAAFELLLVAGREPGSEELSHAGPESSVLRVDCTREGCWEADIILLAISPALEQTVSKLKDVATQKIVLLVAGNREAALHYPAVQKLQQWLPYSKIISVIRRNGRQLAICGEDSSAVEDISAVFQAAGLETEIAGAPCGSPLSSSLHSS